MHTAKEKKLGVQEVNQQLYLYNNQTPIEKKIVTDYQYLWVLPYISSYFQDGAVQNLEPSSQIFNDESVGFLLSSPSSDISSQVPGFIEERIKSGQYTEIFSTKGYRFIKIR